MALPGRPIVDCLRQWSANGALRTRVVTAGLVVVASAGSVLLYSAYGRPPIERADVVVRYPTMPAPSTGTAAPVVGQATAAPPGASAAVDGTAAAQPSRASVVSNPARTPGPPARPNLADLLRPGAEPISRIDISLDGSATGQVAVTSRYTVTDGCQPLFADLFSVTDGSWKRVFSASDGEMAYGAILPSPAAPADSCYPQIRLFSAQPALAPASPLLLLGAAYADTSLRLVIVGWDADARQPAIRFDWRTGANGRVARSTDGQQLDLSEDAKAPDGETTSIGRFLQVIALNGSVPEVVSRRLSPNCDRGRLGAGADVRLSVVLDCSSGARTVFTIDEGTLFTPAGVVQRDLKEGDSVQVAFSAASLEPNETGNTVPAAATLNDFSASNRKQAAERAAPRATAPARSAAPAAPAQPRATRPPAVAPPAREPLYPSTSGGPSHPAATVYVPPPPRAAAPLPAVSPPSAPRGLPGGAPPVPP